MLDLHTHTFHGDARLSPGGLAGRFLDAGYRGVAVTDHADHCNLDWILEHQIPGLIRFGPYCGINIFAGVELTQVPPALIGDMVRTARRGGAELVLVHGESISEQVFPGTNLAAIEADADILAHPGLISDEEVELAAQRGVALEISVRQGHCLCNGHIAAAARRFGAKLVINSDAHSSSDIPLASMRRHIALGAGLSEEEYQKAEGNAEKIASRILHRGRSLA